MREFGWNWLPVLEFGTDWQSVLPRESPLPCGATSGEGCRIGYNPDNWHNPNLADSSRVAIAPQLHRPMKE